ncbi:HNH endonuclease [Sulfuricurvum sp.]|uniref:HNH endonuclease n=1 Tax=Sulfuricurvum sp. TaxID=2025608 RepID=UPI003567B271
MNGIAWSVEEIYILRKFGPLESPKELTKRLPKRSISAIGTKKYMLFIKMQPVPEKDWKIGPYLYRRINGKLIAVHRLVMEKFLGRKLTKEERVHHIDCNPRNNELNNLYLCSNHSHHQRIHTKVTSFIEELFHRGAISFDKNIGTYYITEDAEYD